MNNRGLRENFCLPSNFAGHVPGGARRYRENKYISAPMLDSANEPIANHEM